MWHRLGHFYFSNSILCQFSAPRRFPYVQMIRCCFGRTISFIRFSNFWYTTCYTHCFVPTSVNYYFIQKKLCQFSLFLKTIFYFYLKMFFNLITGDSIYSTAINLLSICKAYLPFFIYSFLFVNSKLQARRETS